jgi:hypothetical protein
MAAMTTVSCLALRVLYERFGDVVILVGLIEVYCPYIDVVLMGCISLRLPNTHTAW